MTLSFFSHNVLGEEHPCQRILGLLENDENLEQLVSNMEDYIESQQGCQLNLRNDLPANCPSFWVGDLSNSVFEDDLAGMNFDNSNFQNARFDVDAPGSSFKEADLRGVDFKQGNFNGAIFKDAQLQGADLGSTKLLGADLSGADLRGADLSNTDLRGADLSGADLRGVDFLQADLTGADLSGAKLDGALIERAKLEDADLRSIIGRPQFIESTYNEATNFPGRDTKYDKSGLENTDEPEESQVTTRKR